MAKSLTQQLEELTEEIKSKPKFKTMPYTIITGCILAILKALELITLSWWIIGAIAVFPLLLVLSIFLVILAIGGIVFIGACLIGVASMVDWSKLNPFKKRGV